MMANLWAIGPHVQAPALSFYWEREEGRSESKMKEKTRQASRLVLSRPSGLSTRRVMSRPSRPSTSHPPMSRSPRSPEASTKLISVVSRPVSYTRRAPCSSRLVSSQSSSSSSFSIVRRVCHRRCIRGPFGRTRAPALSSVEVRQRRVETEWREHAPVSHRVGAPVDGSWAWDDSTVVRCRPSESWLVVVAVALLSRFSSSAGDTQQKPWRRTMVTAQWALHLRLSTPRTVAVWTVFERVPDRDTVPTPAPPVPRTLQVQPNLCPTLGLFHSSPWGDA